MKKTNIKLSLDAMAIEIGNLCNPPISDVKVNIHYFGGDSVSILTTGLPKDKPSMVILDLDKIRDASKFLQDIMYHNLRIEGLHKRVNQLENENYVMRNMADKYNELEKENILLRTDLNALKNNKP